MANRPVEIVFDADTKSVIRGAGNMADSFDDVADALRDLGNDGERAVDDLTDSTRDAEDAVDRLGRTGRDAADDIERGAGDAEDSISTLERQVRDAMDSTDALGREGGDAFDRLSDSARDAGRRVGDSTTEGFDRASEGAQEFRDEAAGTAREAAASFDGSAESISEVFQEVAANAFGGFGPAGAAAGIAAAVGLGIALTKLQELAEENTEAKEAVAELAREIYDAGGAFDTADIAGKVQDIAFALASEDVWYKWGDQAQTNIGLVKEALGDVEDIDAGDSFRALAGDLEAAARVQEDLTRSIEDGERSLKDHIAVVDEYGNVHLTAEGDAIKNSIDARKRLQEQIEESSGVQKDATDEVQFFTEAMGESEDAVAAANEALIAHAEALDAAAGKAMSADQAEINFAETLAESTETIAKNGRTNDIATEAGRSNRKALIDQASAAADMTAALIEQGASTSTVTERTKLARAAFIKSAEASGYSKSEAKKLADQYGLIPDNVDTYVKAHDVQKTKNEIDGVADDRTATVDAKLGSTHDVTNFLDGLSMKKVVVNFVGKIGKAFQ